MKYIVTLGYKQFEFDDSITAMTFAELAVKNAVKGKYDINFEVSIELRKGEETC